MTCDPRAAAEGQWGWQTHAGFGKGVPFKTARTLTLIPFSRKKGEYKE